MKLYVADRFEGWRATALSVLKGIFDDSLRCFPDDWAAVTVAQLASDPEFAGKSEKLVKAETMPFIKYKKVEAEQGGVQVCTRTCCKQ